MSIKAILFDVDGTLIDSEPLSQMTVCQMYGRYGVKIYREEVAKFCGFNDRTIFATLNDRYGVVADPEEQTVQREVLYDEQACEKLQFVPGAAAFVKACKAAGLKIAVATGATRKHLGSNLRALGLDFDIFDAIVCGNEVEHSKPAADIYLKAAAFLGLQPSECLVFEDSDNGHRSARSAGCASIGIMTSFSGEVQISCGAAAVMNDFTQFPEFSDVTGFNEAYKSFLNSFRLN